MVKQVHFLFELLVLVSVLFCITVGLPAPDEERYIDKEYNREFLNWLSSIQYPDQVMNPCKYYYAGPGPMPKRNSELINSLLSLPKNMNDAGK